MKCAAFALSIDERVRDPARIGLLGTLTVLTFTGLALADDYPTIAGALAAPLLKNRDDLESAYADGQVMLRIELARQRLQSATSVSPSLAISRQNILRQLDACYRSMQEIRRLDSKMPDMEAIARKAVEASPALVRRNPETGQLTPRDRQAVGELGGTLMVEGLKAIADAWKASNERDHYRECYRTAGRETLALAGIAKERCKAQEPVLYGVGITIEITDDAVLVDEAIADGPAAKAGIQKGDELIAVDGHKITKSDGKATVIDRSACAALRGGRDSAVALVYARGGIVKTAQLLRSFPVRKRLLDIDFDASWNATFSQDSIDLRNISGEALTNCTLLVTLDGTHGDSNQPMQRQHLHYLDRWSPDEWRFAWYRSSTADGIAADESIDRVQRVVIELYSDQYRDIIIHQYAGTPDATEDIDRYVGLVDKHQKFTLGNIANNLFTDAGVSLQHDGTFNFIPDPKLTVTLKRGSEARTVVFRASGKPWKAGYLSALALKDPSFNDMNPDRVEIDMEFPGSSKKMSFSWNVSNR